MKGFQGIKDYIYLSEALMIDDIPLDSYGERLGVVDKSDSASNGKLEQPVEGPIGDLKKSAYANVNVSTRAIPKTDGGNLGCAAAVSIIFYRGTGYSIVPGKKIELSTGAMWDYLVNASDRFRKIDNWKTDYQPGDIIITKRGSRPGHVGIVVDNGKVVSNSSGGFQGDQKGQIELNYTVSGWQSVANRNPSKTALFRYVGPYRKVWGGEGSNRPDNSGTTVTDRKEIAYGSTGPSVVNLQMALINSGYDLPKYGADGKFFAETRGVLKRFQKDKGISETGVLDRATSDALLGSESAHSPSTGTDLKGKRFKIFDLKKRSIVTAKVESDETITIKNKSGERIGSAKRDGDKIILEYDGETMEATSDSDNKVAKSIFNIYKRMSKPSSTQTGTAGTSGSGDFISINSTGDRDQNLPLLAGKPKVLFVGDSQTAAPYSYANELIKSGEVTGKVVAAPGASTYVIRDMLRDEMLKIGSTGEKYDAVSIMAGGNDAWKDQPTAAIENLKAIYQMIKDAGMKVIALSNPTKQLIDNPNKYPSNELIAKWVESGGDGLVDAVVPVNSKTKSTLSAFGPDKIHLNSSGHTIVKSLWKTAAGSSNVA